VEKFRFLHIFSWKRFILHWHSKCIAHQKRYLSRNVFDESLSSEPVPVRWNLRFPRHLLETTHAWFMIITIISKNIAPPFVHKFPLLIVYKKLRILVIGTHYGLSVWCVYTLANSENKQFSKLSYQFFWHRRPRSLKLKDYFKHRPLRNWSASFLLHWAERLLIDFSWNNCQDRLIKK
jgi:hypothetical protein